MLRSHLDHLIVTAPTLDAGAGFICETLGVQPEPGGRHPQMGTHNCLLRLGETSYLEVIAVDPEALAPEHPRWFRLDHIKPHDAPRLAGWVARTSDIHAAVAAYPSGQIQAMKRGLFDWRIALLQDGSLPFKGVAPMLIQWDCPEHPASLLRDQGCSLARLEGFHENALAIGSVLRCIGFQDAFTVSGLQSGETPCLAAHIQTPSGIRTLISPGAHHG